MSIPKWLERENILKSNNSGQLFKFKYWLDHLQPIPKAKGFFVAYNYGIADGDELAEFAGICKDNGYMFSITNQTEYHPNTMKITISPRETDVTFEQYMEGLKILDNKFSKPPYNIPKIYTDKNDTVEEELIELFQEYDEKSDENKRRLEEIEKKLGIIY